ncbi:MAG: hypothetical protein WBN28_07060 [Lutimonas sp.]
MKKLFKIVLFSAAMLFLQSCYYDTVIVDEGEIIPPETDVSYSEEIMPIWADYCVNCHKGNIPPDLRPAVSYDDLLNGYVVPGDADGSILYQSLLGTNGVSLMPPGAKLSNTNIALVQAWINQGAKNN